MRFCRGFLATSKDEVEACLLKIPAVMTINGSHSSAGFEGW